MFLLNEKEQMALIIIGLRTLDTFTNNKMTYEEMAEAYLKVDRETPRYKDLDIAEEEVAYLFRVAKTSTL